jgi:hypothetical protein
MNNHAFGRIARFGSLAALALCAGTAAAAAGSVRSGAAATGAQASAGEPVDSFPVLTRLHDWQVIDERTVIVWANPWQPYLVTLAYPSHDLPFVQTIGVTSLGDRVYAHFDSLRVAGFRYPIDNIYKMTKQEAKELARQS